MTEAIAVVAVSRVAKASAQRAHRPVTVDEMASWARCHRSRWDARLIDGLAARRELRGAVLCARSWGFARDRVVA